METGVSEHPQEFFCLSISTSFSLVVKIGEVNNCLRLGSADAKMNNFPGLFRNQEINLMALCNLGGVCTMGIATCHLIFKGKALEFSLV